MAIETLLPCFARGKFDQQGLKDIRCWGRNGWFVPHGFHVRLHEEMPDWRSAHVEIEIEGKQSWKGCSAPIKVRLGREDLKLLLEALERLERLERANKEVTTNNGA